MPARLFGPSLRVLRYVLISAACVLAAPGGAMATPSSGSVPVPHAAGDTLERIASEATEAVVLIEASTPSGSSQGSGFFVDAKGLILTNHHVIRDARSVQVRVASGDVYDRVSILAVDERRDIAVLQIPGFDLPTLPLGNSDSVRVGSEVIAIGSPLGLENTVSTGIISGRRQEPEGYQVLQISAPASQGSSGGPVMSRQGLVVGIAVSQMRDGQNLNFALPINYARGLLEHLGDEPVARLGPSESVERSRTRRMGASTEPVNRRLQFDLTDFGGYHVEMDGMVGDQRQQKTRITYRRIEAVGDRQARIERYHESETTERRGAFGTPQIIRRERSRTIVTADDLRPVSAQGEIAWWTGGEWQRSEYRLRFEDSRVRGSRTDTTGRSTDVDRELPEGVVLRGMRDLAFASLSADSLVGRSVEFVTFDPVADELASDRYDVRDTTTVQVGGQSYEALVVNVATGLTNSTSYFRRDRPRVLLRKENGPVDRAQEVTEMELSPPPAPPESANDTPSASASRGIGGAKDVGRGTAARSHAPDALDGSRNTFRVGLARVGKLSVIREGERHPVTSERVHVRYCDC